MHRSDSVINAQQNIYQILVKLESKCHYFLACLDIYIAPLFYRVFFGQIILEGRGINMSCLSLILCFNM